MIYLFSIELSNCTNMKKKIIYIHLVFLSMLFCFSCDNDDQEESGEVIVTSNIKLSDLGQVKPLIDFKMEEKGSMVRCEVKTNLIKKGDEVQEVQLTLTGKVLNFNIITTPNDFDCMDLSCFSTHTVTFDINKKLNSGTYDIELGINNGYGKDYLFKYEYNK